MSHAVLGPQVQTCLHVKETGMESYAFYTKPRLLSQELECRIQGHKVKWNSIRRALEFSNVIRTPGDTFGSVSCMWGETLGISNEMFIILYL